MALPSLTLRASVFFGFESAGIFGAFAIASRIRSSEWAWFWEGNIIAKALLATVVCQLCLYYSELYGPRRSVDGRELAIRLVRALGAASLILSVLYYWFPVLVIGRGVVVMASVLILTFVTAWRFTFEWVGQRLAPRERILLVGSSPATIALVRELEESRARLGVEIVGFVDSGPRRTDPSELHFIGSIDDLPRIVREQLVDRVIVSLAEARGRLPMERLLQMKIADGISFDHLASVYEEYTGKIALENLRPSWFVFSEGFRKSIWIKASKRAVDIGASALGLVVVAPVMACVAAAVRLTSEGPALYHQQRVGERGHLFTVHKFRSMRVDAEAATGAVWAKTNDSRVTPCGKFLRKTRLDELPQLWNVLVGEMSLVGPRPERPEFVTQLTQQIPFYGERHAVRPGLTGWAQVSYSYGSSVEDALEKLQYDLYYVKNLSLSLDFYILFETVKTVLLGKGT